MTIGTNININLYVTQNAARTLGLEKESRKFCIPTVSYSGEIKFQFVKARYNAQNRGIKKKIAE